MDPPSQNEGKTVIFGNRTAIWSKSLVAETSSTKSPFYFRVPPEIREEPFKLVVKNYLWTTKLACLVF